MNRIIYILLKNNFKLIPIYLKYKRAIKEKNINYLLEIINIALNTSNLELNFIGREKIENLEKFVVFSNHQSIYDPLFIMQGCNRNISFIVKDELSKIKILNNIFILNGSQPIDRQNPKSAMKGIINLNEKIKNENCIIGVFPEGTRNKTNILNEFKPGSFKLGTKIGVPIVPIVIKNALDIEKNSKKRTIIIEFLDPIFEENYKDLKTNELAKNIQNLIQQKL